MRQQDNLNVKTTLLTPYCVHVDVCGRIPELGMRVT